MSDYEKFRPPVCCVCGHTWEVHNENVCFIGGCDCPKYVADLPEPVSIQEEIDRS